MLSISVQSGIRVRKHSGNIPSNITVQVHYYHSTGSNITKFYITMGYKIWFTRDLHGPKVVDALEQEGGISRKSDKEDGFGGPSDMFSSFCQVPILELVTFPLYTPISNKILTNIQAPRSGHAIQGCQNATQRVHKECQVACTGIHQWNHTYINMYGHISICHM